MSTAGICSDSPSASDPPTLHPSRGFSQDVEVVRDLSPSVSLPVSLSLLFWGVLFPPDVSDRSARPSVLPQTVSPSVYLFLSALSLLSFLRFKEEEPHVPPSMPIKTLLTVKTVHPHMSAQIQIGFGLKKAWRTRSLIQIQGDLDWRYCVTTLKVYCSNKVLYGITIYLHHAVTMSHYIVKWLMFIH